MDAPMRFKGSRITLNRIARSPQIAGGRLARAASKYVRNGLGGPRRASARMASQARTAGRMVGLLRDTERVGFAAAARAFGIEDLSGKTPEEIGEILTEAFLEKGGGIDDGISNRAWTDTVIEAIESDQLTDPSIPQDVLVIMLENYVTRTIELRLLQDIGNQVLPIAPDAEQAAEMKEGLRGLLRAEVHRTVGPILAQTGGVAQSRVSAIARTIYERAFEYVQALGEED